MKTVSQYHLKENLCLWSKLTYIFECNERQRHKVCLGTLMSATCTVWVVQSCEETCIRQKYGMQDTWRSCEGGGGRGRIHDVAVEVAVEGCEQTVSVDTLFPLSSTASLVVPHIFDRGPWNERYRAQTLLGREWGSCWESTIAIVVT